MIGDLISKPQKELFVWMRENILNLSGSTSMAMHKSVLKGRKNRYDANNEE